jgi:hypothetical protein
MKVTCVINHDKGERFQATLAKIRRGSTILVSGNLYEVGGGLYVDPTDLSFLGSQWGGKSKKEEGSLPEPWVKKEEDNTATSSGSSASAATPTGILAVASKRQSPVEKSRVLGSHNV